MKHYIIQKTRSDDMWTVYRKVWIFRFAIGKYRMLDEAVRRMKQCI